jgi:5-formyltetrahydrofolate cyclo-ligase
LHAASLLCVGAVASVGSAGSHRAMTSFPPPDPHRGPIRARLRAVRREIDAAEQAAAADAIAAGIATLASWEPARRVAVYRADGGEIDPAPLARRARDEGKITYAPVLRGEVLRFAPFDDATAWVANRYGIDEPEVSGIGEIGAPELDLVIVPAVAVDAAGHRLGMGAGWYDRTFAWLAEAARPATPRLIAIMHDIGVVDEIMSQPWDVPMDAIVTPTRLIVVTG